MPGSTTIDSRSRRNLDERRSSSRGPNQTTSRTQGRDEMRGKTKESTFMDRWVEPALAPPKPSYHDHGASAYGVLENMQALGEAPNAKMRARVKAEGTRKSILGRSSAALGVDGLDTPEGSPAPALPTSQLVDSELQQPVVDDERDADYAPVVNGKKRERITRTRAVKQKNEPALSEPSATTALSTPDPRNYTFAYEDDKLRRVVEAAKARAVEVGKPDIASAVNEVYTESLTNFELRVLLESILMKSANEQQQAEFQSYVRKAKKKQKHAKNRARRESGATPDQSPSQVKQQTATPRVTFQSVPSLAIKSPIPSTEHPEGSPSKTKLSLKVSKSPLRNSGRQRGLSNMSASPRKRPGSAGSDSSLTSLTSNEADDDMDLDDEPAANGNMPGPSSRLNGVRVKDHAAERGSLAPPLGGMKRSSAEAELEEERDRALAAKKQKLRETVTRDGEFEESNLRPERLEPRRLTRVREGAPPPSLRLNPPGSRNASARDSRAPSTDLDSPLSELSPAASRASTPRTMKPQFPKLTGKRAKTKQSPQKKPTGASSQGMRMLGASGVARQSPTGDDDNEEAPSENNDFCSACGGSGFLLCCDGCDRSFHFKCLDLPLNEDAKELDEPWYCYICVAKRPITADSTASEKPLRGLFAPLLNNLKKQNPKNFELPDEIRHYFEGVATDQDGAFAETLNVPKITRSRPGYSDDQPDYYKLRDGKGNLVHCYSCGKTSQGKRAIVTCDHCNQHWHLDCLSPPLANPPALNQNGRKVQDWMCPLHADQEMRRVQMSLLGRHQRTVRIRRAKNAKTTEAPMIRGFINNGLIEVTDDESDASDSEFYENDDDGTVYKLPAHGIKLDFIDRVKRSRIQAIREQRAWYGAPQRNSPSALEQANFAKRPFNEKQVALQLAQFAQENQDLELGSDRVENLVGTLIAEAPAEVVSEMMAAEDAEKARSASSAIPPSPPSSEQPDQLSAAQRKELQLLQELIKRRLEATKT